MKIRRHVVSVSPEERKIPICISLNTKEIQKVDNATTKRGFKKRSEYILWLISKDAKGHRS